MLGYPEATVHSVPCTRPPREGMGWNQASAPLSTPVDVSAQSRYHFSALMEPAGWLRSRGPADGGGLWARSPSRDLKDTSQGREQLSLSGRQSAMWRKAQFKLAQLERKRKGRHSWEVQGRSHTWPSSDTWLPRCRSLSPTHRRFQGWLRLR